eukprot:153779_1
MPQPSASEVQAKLRARYGNKAGSTRTGGGKNAMRRKKFRQKKSTNEFEKRLQSNLKKLSCNTIPGIEEVNLFKSDGTVIHFISPKVDAEVSSNTFIVSGNYTHNKIEELLPDILPQIGSDHLTQLKDYAEKFEALKPNNDDENDADNVGAGADDADVPMLIDEDLNFEQIAQADAEAVDVDVDDAAAAAVDVDDAVDSKEDDNENDKEKETEPQPIDDAAKQDDNETIDTTDATKKEAQTIQNTENTQDQDTTESNQ